MSIQSTVYTDWKCSKNRSYAKTICRTSSPAESFAMLHFSHCEKENLVILMMRVRQETGHGNQARYQEFYRMAVRNEEKQADKKENAKLYSFIRKAYNLHFNDRYTVDNPDSFIMDIKRTIPYRSQKSLESLIMSSKM